MDFISDFNIFMKIYQISCSSIQRSQTEKTEIRIGPHAKAAVSLSASRSL